MEVALSIMTRVCEGFCSAADSAAGAISAGGGASCEVRCEVVAQAASMSELKAARAALFRTALLIPW